MTNTKTFEVPGPPVPKERPRQGNGHVYTPTRTKQHQKLIWAYAAAAGVRTITGDVSLSCWFHMKNHHVGDADNLMKCVCDALEGIAYPNDRFVTAKHAWKIRSTNPRTVITIGPATE